MSMHSHDVIIAGAGPAGLSVAIELGRRQIDCLVVESSERGAYKGPRTNLINTRSMEHLRRWGIVDVLRRNNPIDPRCTRDVVFCTTVNGHVLHNFASPFVSERRDDRYSEGAEWIPQRSIEATLRDYAESLPSVTFAWGQEVTSFTQDADQVQVTIASSAEPTRTETLEARYLTGCDGSRSATRQGLGVRLEGTPNMLNALVYDVRIPTLPEVSKVGFASIFWCVGGAFGGDHSTFLCPQDSDGGTQLVVMPWPATCDRDDPDDVKKVLFAAIGEELPVELIAGGGWTLHSIMAPTFQDGRVFIAGDAAHLIPNLGGFGMNISLLDGVDLGWKIAATMTGWGGENLLSSYTAERRTADLWVKEIQDYNAAILSPEIYRPGMEEDTAEGAAIRSEIQEVIVETKTQEFSSLGCQLGYRYENSPIVVADGPPPKDPITYIESGVPGSLCPHRWLPDGSSLYDHFGPEFTLLSTRPGTETRALEHAAQQRRVPLTVTEVDHAELATLIGAQLALIRPDQHVAWRGNVAADPLGVIDTVRGAR